MDRPSRKTKTVNYCEAKDLDDDEDFAVVKAPPSKKSKEETKKEHKQSSGKSVSQETHSQTSSQKNRKPLDEKLLERDLEAAITLSMLNDTDLGKEPSHTNKENRAERLLGENTDPPPLIRSNCSVDCEALGLDKITSENQKKGQKKTEEPKKKDEDDDYEPKLTPDSESDEDFSEPDESDDEEFTVKKSSKTKKKEKTTKSEKPKTSPAANKAKRPSKPSKPKSTASTPIRSPPPAKPAPKRSVSSSAVSSSRPSASVSPAGGRVPKWNPPAQIGKSPTSCERPAGRSPGQGLRLGLSRLVRVKPLHPGVASH